MKKHEYDLCVQISKKWLRSGKTISKGTLRTCDLVTSTKTFLNHARDHLTETSAVYGVTEQEITDIIYNAQNLLNTMDYIHDRYGPSETLDIFIDDVLYPFYHEELIPFLDDLLPDGYYFGSIAGNSAHIGVWKTEGNDIV